MIYGFIPARGGSTRLADKNIRELCGMPLIGWTLQAAMKSELIDQVIFSSDSDNYIEIAKSLCKDYSKLLLIDKRDAEHAGTKSKIFDYLKGGLLSRFSFEADDMIVQLLPTCPLRNESHIDEAIGLARQQGSGCFAACEYDFHVSFAFYQDEEEADGWRALLPDSPMLTGNTQSQTQKTCLHTNGSINCLPVSLLQQGNDSIYYGCVPYKMARLDSVDIDGIEDFDLADAILSKRQST